MPTTNGDAVFNEMLQFTVDTEQFATDLKQIESQWDAALDNMSAATAAKGFKANDLFDPKAIEDQLEGLKTVVQDLATSIGTAFEAVTKNINEQLDEVQAKAEKAQAALAEGGAAAGGGGMRGSGMHPRVRTFGFGESTGGFLGDFGQGFAGSGISMGQMMGAMTRFMLMWQAIQLIITAVKDTITAIPNAIEGLLSGGFEYLDKLNEKHQLLVQGLDQYKDRWEGIVASPVFKAFNEILQKISKWLNDNRALVDDFGAALGKVFGDLFNAGKEFISLNWNSLVVVFGLMAKAAVSIVANFSQLINLVTRLEAFGKNNLTIIGLSSAESPSGNPIDVDEAIQKKALTDDAAAQKRFKDTQDKITADQLSTFASIDKLMDGGKGKGVSGFPLLSDDALKNLRSSFQNTFASIREEYDKTRESYESLIKRHEQSVQDMAPMIDASWGKEQKEIEGVITSLKAHAVNTGANIQQVKAFGDSLDKAFANFNRQKDKAQTTLGDRVFGEQSAQGKLSLETRAKMIELDAQAEINIAQKLGQEKVISEDEAASRIMKATQKSHDAKIEAWEDERSHYGTNTTEFKKLTDEIAEADVQLSTKMVGLSHQRMDAIEKEIRLREQLVQGAVNLDAGDARLAASEARSGGASSQTQYGLDVASAKAQLNASQVASVNAFADYLRAKLDHELTPEAVEQFHQTWMKALQQVDQATEDVNQKKLKGSLQDVLFGGPESLSKHFSDVSETAKSLNTAFKQLDTAVQTIQKGFQQGGLLGGLGAIGSVGGGFMDEISKSLSGSKGTLGAIGSFMGEAGPIAGAAGTLFSILGGVFANAAKQIAADVEKSYKKIIQDYQAGNTDFSTTMANLEKERQDAISRLGGKKKGKSELQGILDQIDQSEQQISQHAEQVRKSFEEQLVIISQGNKVAQDWVKTWTDINKQVKEYMDNGGNALYAHQYLTQQFNQQLVDLQGQYNDAEEQAIQDAYTMNSLLDQRSKIEDSIKKTTDDINKLNKPVEDSIERREAGAITANRQQQDQLKTLQDQLKSEQDQLTNNQRDLDLTTQKWNREKDLFGLTNDINQLHQKDAELQLSALDQQIQKWSSMKYIIDQIHAEMAAGFNPAGSFSGGLFSGVSPIQGLVPGAIPGFGAGAAPAPVIHVYLPNIDPGTNATDYGRRIGGGIASELYWGRRGAFMD